MTDIRLPEPINEDIYSLGFDKSLNRDIPDNSTGVVYDYMDGVNAAQLLQGGNINAKTITIGGLTRQVAPGDDIQAAIDAVSREGGGTVQLLADTYSVRANVVIKDKVNLTGSGRGVTVLDFGGTPYNLSATNSSNFSVRGLSLVGGSTTAVVIASCSNFDITNAGFLSGTGNANGFYFKSSSDFLVDNCKTERTTGINYQYGFYFEDNGFGSSNENYRISGCNADQYETTGFYIAADNFRGNLFSNNANSDRAASISAYTIGASSILVTNCNGQQGDIAAFVVTGSSNVFLGCNTDSGQLFTISGNSNAFIGNSGTFGFTGASTLPPNILIGNTNSGYSNTSPAAIWGVEDASVISFGNEYQSDRTDKRMLSLNNSSGQTLRQGNVVVLAPGTTTGQEVTTTTINGDNRVWGMLVESSVANGAWGDTMSNGFTSLLFANNSASSISIGDYLSTYSHAYYAKKATAGEMVFAIALEAPTTSTAQIDALLISPRLI